MKLLLAEDEMRMAASLTELFRQEGYETAVFYDGQEALAALLKGKYDAAVLDVMMPGRNGFDVTAEARSKGVMTPILLLTAKAELDDKVAGLDCGADDYLTKPFQPRELLARLRALCRRRTGTQEGILAFGDITLDTASAAVICRTTGQSIRLGEKELKILEALIANCNQILTREQLAVRIWGYDSEAEYNNVEVYMTFTRKKLTFIGSKTVIKAVRGIGYEVRYDDVH